MTRVPTLNHRLSWWRSTSVGVNEVVKSRRPASPLTLETPSLQVKLIQSSYSLLITDLVLFDRFIVLSNQMWEFRRFWGVIIFDMMCVIILNTITLILIIRPCLIWAVRYHEWVFLPFVGWMKKRFVQRMSQLLCPLGGNGLRPQRRRSNTNSPTHSWAGRSEARFSRTLDRSETWLSHWEARTLGFLRQNVNTTPSLWERSQRTRPV